MAEASRAARIAGSQVVGGSALTSSVVIGDAAAARNLSALLRQCVEHAVAAGAVDVANVGLHAHARGDAVDRAGKHIANANGADGIDCAGRFRRRFECKNQLCRRGQRILASGHQLAARVAAFALNDDALGWRARRCA